MTDQEAFDCAATGLIRQARKSFSDSGGCAYRGNWNCRCGIGHIIQDDEYRPAMEQRSVQNLVAAFSIPSLRTVRLPLLSDIQAVHDLNPPNTWPTILTEMAGRHSLSTAALDQAIKSRDCPEPS